MAVRGGHRAAATGIQLEDLPQGQTTYKITKEHEPEPRSDLPTADDAEGFQWQIQRKDNGICEYVNLHDGKPALHELAAMYGPGLYVLTPLDPQTRKEIKSLTEHAKIAAPAMTHNPMQVQQQSAPIDLSLVLIQRQQQQQDDERERMRAEQAEARRAEADARAEQRRLDDERRREERESRDKMWQAGLGIVASLGAALPAMLGALKTTLAPPPPPPSTDSKVVDTLVDELREARRRLDGSSNGSSFDQTMERMTQLVMIKQLGRELRDDDEEGGTLGEIKEMMGLAKEGLPMLASLTSKPAEQQQGQAYNPFASPSALLQAAMADPAQAERTLAELGRQHPEQGAKLAAMLQGAAEDESEDAKPRKLRAAK
jgi:hypothetical protein